MSMTWFDIKLATLQKMFAADGSEIPEDQSTVDYIAGMPYVANEALQRLATTGKFITKSIVINHSPLDNLLDENSARKIVNFSDEFVVKCDGARSAYVEVSGIVKIEIYAGDTKQSEIDVDSMGTYTEHRELIPATATSIKFVTQYPASIKNLALYKENYPSADMIPAYGDKVRYNLRELCDDFYQLGENQIYYEGENPTYLQTSEYYRESDCVLLLDRNMPGKYTVYYRSYPGEITKDTPDEYVLPLDKEVSVLLPLYMASELYKDDDNSIATVYRNEFEVAIGELRDTSTASGYEHFTSESGWI